MEFPKQSIACPQCGGRATDVKDSRPLTGGIAIRRRRLCTSCGNRFSTFERGEDMVGTDLSWTHKALIRKIHDLPSRDVTLLLSIAGRLSKDDEEDEKPRENMLDDYDAIVDMANKLPGENAS